MLSDALKQAREALVRPIDLDELMLLLRAMEIEAANLEQRIFFLTGRPHAPIPLMAGMPADMVVTQ